eukprot:12097-Prymnesium_polylepis.3
MPLLPPRHTPAAAHHVTRTAHRELDTGVTRQANANLAPPSPRFDFDVHETYSRMRCERAAPDPLHLGRRTQPCSLATGPPHNAIGSSESKS